MNARSSRSHTILVISYQQVNADGSRKSAKLNLVDLAGSERLKRTGAEGQTMKEAANINLSLSKLGLCIMRLTEGASHVPFKDSALTKFLQESLGGNSKTTLLCTSSKSHLNVEESIGTLRFA